MKLTDKFLMINFRHILKKLNVPPKRIGRTPREAINTASANLKCVIFCLSKQCEEKREKLHPKMQKLAKIERELHEFIRTLPE